MNGESPNGTVSNLTTPTADMSDYPAGSKAICTGPDGSLRLALVVDVEGTWRSILLAEPYVPGGPLTDVVPVDQLHDEWIAHWVDMIGGSWYFWQPDQSQHGPYPTEQAAWLACLTTPYDE